MKTTQYSPDRTAARRTLGRLERSQVDGRLAPDCRRVMRDEMDSLRIALRRGEGIAAAAIEARRVMAMWGVE